MKNANIVYGCCLLASLVSSLPFSLLANDHPASVSFSTAPQDQTVCAGSPATFIVGAAGSASLTYQWQLSTDGGANWNPISNGAAYTGATSMNLRVTAASLAFNNFKYRCIVSDGVSATSSAATLHVNAGTGPVPSLSGDISQTQCAFTIGVSPVNTQTSFNYQWQMSTDGSTWGNVDPSDPSYTGTTDAVLQWDGSQTAGSSNLYRYVMTNSGSGCSAISAIDTIRIAPAPTSLVPNPASTSICSAGSTTFTFLSPPSGYAFHWQESTDNGVNYTDVTNNSTYSGVLSPALTLTGITTAMKYRARTSLTTFNQTCETFSIAATLTIKTLPAITLQPADQLVCANTSPKFAVTATGSTISYQWQTDNGTGSVWSSVSAGSSGATTLRVTLNNVPVTMDGYKYKVAVSGPCGGTQTSNIVTLHIGSSGTWLGTQDTAWEHVGNWCSIVPVQSTDVLVPAWAPRMPLISSGTGTAYAQKLTIQNGASLTISGGIVSMTGPFILPGTVSYTGSLDQQVLPGDHGSLYISGSGNKVLQNNVAISNNLGLGGAAKLVTGNYILTMGAGANPITGATFTGVGTSWIVTGNGSSGAVNTGKGGLRMMQVPSTASNLLFPIGPTPATYNPLLLTNGGIVNDFTIAVNDQNIPGGAVGGVIDRTWLVNAANAGSTIALRLLWSLADEPVTFDRNSAAVLRSNGARIVEKTNAAAASGANPYSVTGGNFSTITQFSVGNNTMIVLPFELLGFTARWIDDASAGLSWKMDAQSEISAFTVQHSIDGVLFTDMGTVHAERGKISYTYTDVHPGEKMFYRLRLHSLDGNITNSRVVTLSAVSLSESARLAPSVVYGSSAKVLLTLGKAADVMYNVSDISGHILSRNAIRLMIGEHSIPLDLSRCPAGIYFVHITDSEGGNKTLTLLKK
jgi:hypothetical protein